MLICTDLILSHLYNLFFVFLFSVFNINPGRPFINEHTRFNLQPPGLEKPGFKIPGIKNMEKHMAAFKFIHSFYTYMDFDAVCT